MEEVLWGTLTGTDICFYGPLRIAGCFICVYMAHVSTRSHSFWRDGTDCKRALETAQNYAYIKHQISTGKNQSKQTHEMTCSQHRSQFMYFFCLSSSTASACLAVPQAQLISHSASWSGQFIMGKMRAGLEKVEKEVRHVQFYLKVSDLPNI